VSKLSGSFQRPQAAELARQLREPRRHIQVVAGARQVGKTTLVQQVIENIALPVRFASADEPTLRGAEWIAQQWEATRLSASAKGAILVLDEVQKTIGWSESIKRLWDEDTRAKRPIKVVLLGSAACPAGAHRESGRTIRDSSPASLVPGGDTSGVRFQHGPIYLLRWLSGRRAVGK
jgi:uncharacterized protein